jgi:ring-1,2-phenylacetyl-CoA epoxidase subunit PaaE
MNQPLYLSVDRLVEETPDALLIYFRTEQIHSFVPGQFLTLLVSINGTTHRRSYSIFTDPAELPHIGVCVKRLPGGLVSNHLLDNLREGDSLEVLPPYGNFALNPASETLTPLVLVGAGSGITPLFSMLSVALRHPSAPVIRLIYGNRSAGEVIFGKALNRLQQQYPQRLQVVHCLSRGQEENPALEGILHAGRVDSGVLSRFVPNTEAAFYLCGPEGLVQDTEAWLRGQGIAGEHIHKELFYQSGPKLMSPTPVSRSADDEPGLLPVVTLKVDGKVYEFAVEPGRFILETALEQGIDLPYACTMGVCGMCRAKKIYGEMHIADQEAISASEIASGACLTCVGRPLSNRLVIDYDVPN